MLLFESILRFQGLKVLINSTVTEFSIYHVHPQNRQSTELTCHRHSLRATVAETHVKTKIALSLYKQKQNSQLQKQEPVFCVQAYCMMGI